MRIPKLKSAYYSVIIGPRGLKCETNLQEIISWESFDVFRFDLGPLLQGQTRMSNLKSAYNLLIIGPRGSQCETNQWEIMDWESSDVFRFDLGPLLQGQTRTEKLESGYNLLIQDPPSRSNDGSLALVSCLSGGYTFASVLRCVGLVKIG